MKRRMIQFASPLVFCVLVGAACASGPSQASKPAATATSTPVPVGTIVQGAMTGASSTGYSIVVSDSAVWVLSEDLGSVTRINPATNAVAAQIDIGSGFGAVGLANGAVWVLNRNDSVVRRIDPGSNRVVATIPIPPPDGYLTASSGTVWVASLASNVVRKIDPETNQVIATLPIDGGPSNMAVGAGSLWICDHHGVQYGVTRLDLATNKVQGRVDSATYGPGFVLGCDGIAASDKAVWEVLLDGAKNNDQGADVGLAHIDPETNQVVATVTLPDEPGGYAVAADDNSVWVVGPSTGIFRIDPTSNKIVAESPMSGAVAVGMGAGKVWVITADSGMVLAITPGS